MNSISTSLRCVCFPVYWMHTSLSCLHKPTTVIPLMVTFLIYSINAYLVGLPYNAEVDHLLVVLSGGGGWPLFGDGSGIVVVNHLKLRRRLGAMYIAIDQMRTNCGYFFVSLIWVQNVEIHSVRVTYQLTVCLLALHLLQCLHEYIKHRAMFCLELTLIFRHTIPCYNMYYNYPPAKVPHVLKTLANSITTW